MTTSPSHPVPRGLPALVSDRRAVLTLAVLWIAAFAGLQWSVVRFRVIIVLTLTCAAAGLAVWLVRRSDVRPGPGTFAGMLVGGAVTTLTVPLFSYLPQGPETWSRLVLAAAGLGAALLLVLRRPTMAMLTALGGYLVSGWTAIMTDPSPHIDVWVTLQQASDALVRGENFYAMEWVGSPGIQDAFTYLPWSAVLLAPGRVLLGDVRWAMLAWTVVLALGVWRLGTATPAAGRRTWLSAVPPGAAGAVAVLVLVPGTLTQVDQAWTEPLLLTGLVWWAALVHSGRPWWAVIPLSVACASKQHLALLLPILLVWRAFGWRRTLVTAAGAAVLMLPWFLASPGDFLHDTVGLLVDFPAIRFANTLYLLAVHEVGVTPPFWLTGFVVLATLLVAVVAVRRRQPDAGELLRWLALVLAVANLVNKQAFYNQYWLVAGLVLVSLVVSSPADRPPAPDGPIASDDRTGASDPGPRTSITSRPGGRGSSAMTS